MRYLLPTALLLGLCASPALSAPDYLEDSHARCKGHVLQTGCLLVETETGAKIHQTYGNRGDFIDVLSSIAFEIDADTAADFLACIHKGAGCDVDALYRAERAAAEARAAERAVGILPAFAAVDTVSCPDNQRERDGRCFPRRFADGWRTATATSDPEGGRNGGSERSEAPDRTPDRPSAPDREPEAPVSEPEPEPSEPAPCV